MENKEHFPLFIKTSNKKALVVGAGNIALRRVKTLLHFNFDITIISIEILKELENLVNEKNIKYIKSSYNSNFINESYFLVLACTDDYECNKNIVRDSKLKNIIVNSCSEKEGCDFYFPALIVDNNLTIGVVGNGENHKKVKDISKKIRGLLN